MNKFIKIVSAITLLVFLRTNFALAAEQVYFYYTDPAGTPLAMSDSSGAVVWRADYMPFGEETVSPASTAPNNKMFVGKEKDSETGLHYFGARYMDSPAGRFISPDPIGAVDPQTGEADPVILSNPQRFNIYAYAGNNPYKYIDPDGKWMLVIEHNKNAQYGSKALVWNGWLPDGIFDMKTRADSNGANAAAKSGFYDYSLGKHEGSFFAKHDALIINNGGEVDTEGPNVKRGNVLKADGIHSHVGNKESKSNTGNTGSEACWVVPAVRGSDTYKPGDPKTWKYYNGYISKFKDHPTGKALLLRFD